MSDTEQDRHVGRTATMAGLLVLALALAAGVVFFGPAISKSLLHIGGCDGPTDLKGNCVQRDDPITAEQERAMNITPVESHAHRKQKGEKKSSKSEESSTEETGARLIAPDQHLDVPLYWMNIVDNVINPPGYREAYLVRGYQDPHDSKDGTTVVVMHAVTGGYAPGNAFFDIPSGNFLIGTGDPLEVDGVKFVVDKAFVDMKTAVASDGDLWQSEPGRLLLITCYDRPNTVGHALENFVIIGHRAT